MHAASRHGTPSLTSLRKDDEVSCEVRPQRSPIQNLTSLDQAYLQSPDEDCISHSATHTAKFGGNPPILSLISGFKTLEFIFSFFEMAGWGNLVSWAFCHIWTETKGPKIGWSHKRTDRPCRFRPALESPKGVRL